MIKYFLESIYYSTILTLFYKIIIIIIFKKCKKLKNFCNMYFKINNYNIIDILLFFLILIIFLLINLLYT